MRFAVCLLLIGCSLGAAPPPGRLTLEDLHILSVVSDTPPDLATRMDRMLRQVTVSNAASLAGVRPHGATGPDGARALRLVQWNIQRGAQVDAIRSLFTDAPRMRSSFEAKARRPGEREWARYQLQALTSADVLVLNEVDHGVARTAYRHIAEEIAGAAHMNHAYAPEFLEVDPRQLAAADPEHYVGLHGTAVLSRYPIAAVRVERLDSCYDWYGAEAEGPGHLERGRRWSMQIAFRERVPREIRRGGRMALIVTLEVPAVTGGRLTVVATHLENKTSPACRQRQMSQLLGSIRETQGPVVLAGDLNTTGTNAAPLSWRSEIVGRLKSPRFWMDRGAGYLWPAGIPRFMLFPAVYYRRQYDPTRRHLPIVADNAEAGLFRLLRDHRFADGGTFDFGGESARTLTRTSKTLANSNERAAKGFEPTWSVPRNIGFVGRFKLDWILVKPGPAGELAPQFPMTMRELNDLAPARMSDHHPISVDLRLPERSTSLAARQW